MRCNQQSKDEEALIALLCWFMGSQRTSHAPNFDLMRNSIKTSWRRFAAILPRESLPLVGQGLRVVPLVRRKFEAAACLLAAKFGLALHFHNTGRILPESGLVTCFYNWQPNIAVADETYHMILTLPESLELRQGTKRSEEIFYCRYRLAGSDGHLMYAVVLHEAIALIGLVAEDDKSCHTRYSRTYRPSPHYGVLFTP
jgi:hypothetical protein